MTVAHIKCRRIQLIMTTKKHKNIDDVILQRKVGTHSFQGEDGIDCLLPSSSDDKPPQFGRVQFDHRLSSSTSQPLVLQAL